MAPPGGGPDHNPTGQAPHRPNAAGGKWVSLTHTPPPARTWPESVLCAATGAEGESAAASAARPLQRVPSSTPGRLTPTCCSTPRSREEFRTGGPGADTRRTARGRGGVRMDADAKIEALRRCPPNPHRAHRREPVANGHHNHIADLVSHAELRGDGRHRAAQAVHPEGQPMSSPRTGHTMAEAMQSTTTNRGAAPVTNRCVPAQLRTLTWRHPAPG